MTRRFIIKVSWKSEYREILEVTAESQCEAVKKAVDKDGKAINDAPFHSSEPEVLRVVEVV